ncbi:hypothetical protein D0Z00_000115 [Geotrichum galactomycetum]|uniref:Uncharacterized protein n=1 Tax=Geotrichum galactomycetum TaxID=27317 RepID=A0ACB6VAY4_9ASCO|nr:hypothetical protein D0Z00_000115 [Geotrichum candidum]
MAPIAVESNISPLVPSEVTTKLPKTTIVGNLDYTSVILSDQEFKESEQAYEHKSLISVTDDSNWSDPEPFEYHDKALLADPKTKYSNLFRDATKVVHINPKIGTVIYGVNLATLDNVQKNELALLISYRLAVFFKDQRDLTPEKQLDLGAYFGPLHRHPNGGWVKQPEDSKFPHELLPIYSRTHRSKDEPLYPASNWHTDVSFEVQPPTYTSLKIVHSPAAGGDTIWSSGYALYDGLSPHLQKYLEGLTALHTSVEQTELYRKSGAHPHRNPITSEHPIVRVHPVTGYKSLYVNPGFTRSIVGVPRAESNAILKFLFTQIESSQEATVRYKWGVNDVAFWDNRAALHRAIADYRPLKRHGVRVTPRGEPPQGTENGTRGKSQNDEIEAAIARRRGDAYVTVETENSKNYRPPKQDLANSVGLRGDA